MSAEHFFHFLDLYVFDQEKKEESCLGWLFFKVCITKSQSLWSMIAIILAYIFYMISVNEKILRKKKREGLWAEVFSEGNRLRIIMSYSRWRYMYRRSPEVLLWCTVEPRFTGTSIVLTDFLVPVKSPYFFDLYFIFFFFTNLTMLMSCFTSLVFCSYKRCYFSYNPPLSNTDTHFLWPLQCQY